MLRPTCCTKSSKSLNSLFLCNTVDCPEKKFATSIVWKASWKSLNASFWAVLFTKLAFLETSYDMPLFESASISRIQGTMVLRLKRLQAEQEDPGILPAVSPKMSRLGQKMVRKNYMVIATQKMMKLTLVVQPLVITVL